MMKENTTAQRAVPIAPALAESLVDTYLQAWNTEDRGEREKLLSEVAIEKVVYVDPSVFCENRESLSKCIANSMKIFEHGTIVLASRVDTHHTTCRFKWQRRFPNGKALPECIDIINFTADGKIANITGFFGNLKSN